MSDMTQPQSNVAKAVARRVDVDARREAYTMALYVSVCLLAALSAVAERTDAGQVDVFKITWGTTIGLAVAHWFAFRVSARLVAAGELGRHEVHTAAAQLVGALAVAVLVTVPVVLLPATAELDVVRLVLAGFVAAIGYAVARNSGASMRRSAIYAASILVIALAIAVLKNVLSGH
jgi:VIT1/CCC1 family predicted Fe2+/Mn2+ transporter